MKWREERERPNMKCKRQVEEQINEIELKKEDAIDRTRWRNGVHKLSRNMRGIKPPALTETKPDLKDGSLSRILLKALIEN